MEGIRKDNMNKIDTPRAVVVLGMHRSGTSVLTRALGALGVYLGENLMPGHFDNQKGFFEDREVYALNEELLEAINCRWDSLTLRNITSELSERYLARAVSLIKNQFGDHALWGLKDPRITRLLPFWQKVFSEANVHPLYVLSNRHPLSVAASLAKRNSMPRGQALALWALHQTSGLETLVQNGGLVVSYELMLRDPDIQLQRLSKFLDSPVMPLTPEIENFKKEFLDSDLCHSELAQDERDIGDNDLDGICQEIYKHLSHLEKMESFICDSHLHEETNQLINHVQNYFNKRINWLEMVDSLQKYNQQDRQRINLLVTDKEKKIKKLESQLSWITNKTSYRTIRAFKNSLKSIY